ncbi:hypothetical protein KFK09_021254 [Dendrobium nobile]|uniref:Uncharacterized protein n=1 Tax=Dendrobium nobile TaxID=94219 RepID=A0A8T3ANW7_DENNO|nr:hypothetical protein KFK09_021254 [Dendrobium nobile]
MYDDDMFDGVLDHEQPTYDVYDDRKMKGQQELVMHIIHDKAMGVLSINDNEFGMIQLEHNNHLCTVAHTDSSCIFVWRRVVTITGVIINRGFPAQGFLNKYYFPQLHQ